MRGRWGGRLGAGGYDGLRRDMRGREEGEAWREEGEGKWGKGREDKRGKFCMRASWEGNKRVGGGEVYPRPSPP